MASRTPLLSGVTIHPTVLLSVVDHYNRIAKDTRKRVVGILLGEVYRGRVDVTNSFAGMIQGNQKKNWKRMLFPSFFPFFGVILIQFALDSSV